MIEHADVSPALSGSTGARGIAPVIAAIGEGRFGAVLQSHLYEAARVEHLSVFRISDDHPAQLLSASQDGTQTASRQTGRYIEDQLWRHDPVMKAACEEEGRTDPAVRIRRLIITDLPQSALRQQVYESQQVCDRVLMSWAAGGHLLGLSVIRTDTLGCFSDEDLHCLELMAPPLFAILDRHLRFAATSVDLSIALSSLDEIERCIAASPEALPRREAEVCARILYGISSIGIALELGISEETVMTYRKRAYLRLEIGSQRELLIWYLRRWSADRPLAELQSGPPRAMRPH